MPRFSQWGGLFLTNATYEVPNALPRPEFFAVLLGTLKAGQAADCSVGNEGWTIQVSIAERSRWLVV